MNKYERAMFVENFIEVVKKDLLSKMDRVPENWDGFELRWWIADTFREQTIDYDGDRRSLAHKRRHRKYANDIAVHNL